MFSRLSQILAGFRWAFRFDNPLEIITARHLFRRKSSIVVTYRGMDILIDSLTSDAHVVGDVLLDGMYDQFLREAGAGRKSFRYLNLGANIGTFDLRAFQTLGSSCAGIAVEMNPATCARLIVNLEANRLFTVRAINAAVWNIPGEITVDLRGRDTGQTCIDSAVGWSVPLVPWQEIFAIASKEGPLDLVKIDIEGAEKCVVPCISAADAERIRFLVVETHGPDARAVVNEHLQNLGFTRLSEEPGGGATHLGFWKGTGAAHIPSTSNL